MVERNGDVRIYIISGIFFFCIIGGGIFLCLYIFLPETPSTFSYLLVGMILVGMPWAFWILTYVYRCCLNQSIDEQDDRDFAVRSSGYQAQSQITPKAESPTGQSPNGERRVHFGAVVVMGAGDGGGQNNDGGEIIDYRLSDDSDDEDDDDDRIEAGRDPRSNSTICEGDLSIGSREAEFPLTLDRFLNEFN